MAKSIPDRWLQYIPIGKRIADTRFIAFKVPLRRKVNENVVADKRLDSDSLLQHVPNLGLIIDLTNTDRYYDPTQFTTQNVQHIKLMIPGHQKPSPDLARKFCQHANDFLHSNAHNDKLIGVHCTHGVNRTGYLICYFMVTVLKMTPTMALEKFSLARGHSIERKNYTADLQRLARKASSSHQRPESTPSGGSERFTKPRSSHHRLHEARRDAESVPQSSWRNTQEQYRELLQKQEQELTKKGKQSMRHRTYETNAQSAHSNYNHRQQSDHQRNSGNDHCQSNYQRNSNSYDNRQSNYVRNDFGYRPQSDAQRTRNQRSAATDRRDSPIGRTDN